MTYSREKQVAIEAVTEAARLCAAVRAELIDVTTLEKRDKSPVTVADFGSQALVCRRLSDAFPHDVVIAEEDGGELQKAENAFLLELTTSYVQRWQPTATARDVCAWIGAGTHTLAERYWTLDPIDGTKGFLRNDQYAIALALVVDGEVKLGVLACPSLPWDMSDPTGAVGVLFDAVAGEGAYISPLEGGEAVPIHVDVAVNGNSLRFVESVESAHGDQRCQQALARAIGLTKRSLRMDSQAKYGAVARGDAVLYLRLPSPQSPDYREKIWDHAAGAIILKEAGGRVTDMHGEPLDFAVDFEMRTNRGVVASNDTLHTSMLRTLSQEGYELFWK